MGTGSDIQTLFVFRFKIENHYFCNLLLNKSQAKISTDRQINISEAPSVTIGIPVLNEEDHIERVVSGFLASDYPNLVEILIADGGSTDGTRDIVQKIAAKDSRVVLVDNPERFQSFALNKMIDIAKGELFMRADAHCEYGRNYIAKCVKELKQEGVKNTGGSARFIATNTFQGGTALSVLSFIGNGGAKHYNPYYKGYADTVPMGFFYLKDLKEIGGFKESNHTNEDAEINQRIRTELGGKIYISDEIELKYYPRKSFGQLLKQYFRYGRGRFLTSSLHKGRIPLRGKAPFLVVSTLILYLISDLVFFNGQLFSRYFLLISLLALLGESARLSFFKRKYFIDEIWKGDKHNIPGRVILTFDVFLIFLTMHLGHFCGYGYQMIRVKLFGKKW